MPRFQVGQRVFINGAVVTRYDQREAIVIGVEVSKHSRPGVTSLDKYFVRFGDGDQAELYDIQLTTAYSRTE